LDDDYEEDLCEKCMIELEEEDIDFNKDDE